MPIPRCTISLPLPLTLFRPFHKEWFFPQNFSFFRVRLSFIIRFSCFSDVFLLVENDNIMDTLNKTKPQLLKELQELVKENDQLKISYEREIKELKKEAEMLRASEQRLSSIYNTVNDVIFQLTVEADNKYRFISINQAFCNITGLTQEQVLGKMVNEVIPEPSLTMVMGKCKQAIDEKRMVEWEEVSEYPRGQVVGQVSIIPVYNNKGVCTNLVGSVNDIKELKLANQALVVSEEKYRVLLKGNTLGILAFDIETHKCVFSNLTACKLFGYKDEEISKLSLADFHPKDSIEKVISEFESQGRSEKSISNALPCLRKDGKIFYADIAGYSTTLDGRNCRIGFIMDVTERKKAEELMEQTRQNYETFFNTIDEFLFVLDEQGNVIHANSTVYDRLGYTRDELFRKPVLMIHPPDRRDEAGRIVGEMLMGSAQLCPIPVQTKSGVQIPVETRVTLGSWNGKPAIFGVTKDISQLRLSEEKFSKLFHINPSACGLSDLETRQYIEVNEVFYKLFGFEKNEVIGKTAFELGILTPESSNAIQMHADSDGRIINVEAKLKAKNGDTKHVMLSAENIYIQDKKYRFTVVYDITELIHIENVLKESEASLRDAQEVARLGSFVWDISAGLWTSSSILDTIFGIDETYIRSLEGWAAIVHPEWRDIMVDYVTKEVLGKHQRFEKEYKIINHKNGEELWVHGLAELKMDKNNQPVKLIGTIIDITERKKAEEALHNERLMIRTLIDNIPDSIYSKDTAGRKTLVNLAEVRFMGAKSESEILGKTDFEVYPKELAESFFADDQEVIQTGKPVLNREEYIFDEKKQKRYLLTSKLPLKNKDGQIIGLVGIGRDITGRKQAEEEIKLKNEQLFKTNAEKDKFISIMAHDLRGPFQPLLGFTRMLVENLPTMRLDEIQKMALSMRGAANKLFNLLENLLEWSRMQQGLIPFTPEKIQLLPVVESIIPFALEPAKIKEIELIIDIPGEISVYADGNMLKSVMRNLVSNAIKFTPRGGKVSVSAKSTIDNSVEFSFKDTGIGMSPSLVDNLYRLDLQTNRKGTEGEPSTGLGLIISKEFVEKNGGRLRVESGEGKGSTFYFTLPGLKDGIPK